MALGAASRSLVGLQWPLREGRLVALEIVPLQALRHVRHHYPRTSFIDLSHLFRLLHHIVEDVVTHAVRQLNTQQRREDRVVASAYLLC